MNGRSIWTRLRIARGFCLVCGDKRTNDDTYCPQHLGGEVVDEREPGEAFCAACPDHEACMSGYPCSLVKRLNGAPR